MRGPSSRVVGTLRDRTLRLRRVGDRGIRAVFGIDGIHLRHSGFGIAQLFLGYLRSHLAAGNDPACGQTVTSRSRSGRRIPFCNRIVRVIITTSRIPRRLGRGTVGIRRRRRPLLRVRLLTRCRR